MSKAGKTPPPPDYAPLAQASEASAKYAYDLGVKQQKWAEKVYAENKDVSDTFVDFIMGQMDKQAGWADADRARYEEIFQPLEDSLAKEAADYASPERQEAESAQAQTAVAQEFEGARRTAQERLEAYGVDPTQTRAGAMDLQTRIAEAAAQAGAGTAARERTENIGRALRSEAINIGKGYPGQIAGQAAGAQGAGQAGVQSGLSTTASGAQTQGTGYQWQGLGNQGIQNWANVLNTGFNNELDLWKAKSQDSSGIGALAGLAIGTGLKAYGMEEGGLIPEPHFQEGGGVPEPPGTAPTNGDIRTPGGGAVPTAMSPSGGIQTDDVAAVVDGAGPAQLNSGEFVIPEDVMKWKGEEWAQKEITKARTAMTGTQGERPAQPTMMSPPQGVLPVG